MLIKVPEGVYYVIKSEKSNLHCTWLTEYQFTSLASILHLKGGQKVFKWC